MLSKLVGVVWVSIQVLDMHECRNQNGRWEPSATFFLFYLFNFIFISCDSNSN